MKEAEIGVGKWGRKYEKRRVRKVQKGYIRGERESEREGG